MEGVSSPLSTYTSPPLSTPQHYLPNIDLHDFGGEGSGKYCTIFHSSYNFYMYLTCMVIELERWVRKGS